LERATFIGDDGWLKTTTFSPDGKQFLMGGFSNTALVWDVATGKLVQKFVHPSDVASGVFTPDGEQIFTGGLDSIARLWDITTGEVVRTFEQNRGAVEVAYAPNGAYVLISGNDGTQVWELPSGRIVHSIAMHGPLAISPDSQRMAISDDLSKTEVYDVASGELLRTFQEPNSPLAVAFSPDSQQVLVASRDNVVRLWDITRGERVREFVGHTNIMWRVDWSPDGRFVLSGSLDKTARLWDVATGTQLRTFPSHGNVAASSIAYAPDGRQVLIGSSDGVAQVAYVELDMLIQDVCARVLRDFTEQERTVYGIREPRSTCPNY
jgi:WD40 repeat protein